MFLASTPSPKAASSGRGVSDTTLSLNLAALPATARLRRKSTRHKGAYHYLTSSSNANDKKSKLTTRHLAALDFLLGIKLTNEATIRKEGQKLKALANEELSGDHRHDDDDDDDGMVPAFNTTNVHDDYNLWNLTDAPGKKLQGPNAHTLRVPPPIRYKVMKLFDQSAVIRQWEDSLLRGVVVIGSSLSSQQQQQQQQPITSSRLYFSRARSYPTSIMSVIKYDTAREEAKLERKNYEDTRGLEVYEVPKRDWRGTSHRKAILEQNNDGEYEKHSYWIERGYLHDPNYIDDPNMIHGAAKQVMLGEVKTGPMISSIILFKNINELKEDLNEQFREEHPELPRFLTLSKIRKLKKSALLGALNLDIEVSTVAMACIYFERLCLKGVVTKFNRKLSMACCLLIAYKFNEHITGSMYGTRMEALLRFFDTEYLIAKADVFKAELGVLVYLNFQLHLPHLHIFEIFKRLLKLIHKNTRAYLPDDMYQEFNKDIIELDLEDDTYDNQMVLGGNFFDDRTSAGKGNNPDRDATSGGLYKCKAAFRMWQNGQLPTCDCCGPRYRQFGNNGDVHSSLADIEEEHASDIEQEKDTLSLSASLSSTFPSSSSVFPSFPSFQSFILQSEPKSHTESPKQSKDENNEISEGVPANVNRSSTSSSNHQEVVRGDISAEGVTEDHNEGAKVTSITSSN